MNVAQRPGPSGRALALGYGGLLPFAGLAAAVWGLDGSARAQSLWALLAYGASILSFLGAIHWGLALRDEAGPSDRLLAWGVVPSLLAWVALLLGPLAGLWLAAAGLGACLAVDRWVYPRFGLQAWLPMRVALTTVASICCVAGALGALR